jgi:hypothetical protein
MDRHHSLSHFLQRFLVLAAGLWFGAVAIAAPPSKLIHVPEPVPDEYIVMFESNVPDVALAARELAAQHGAHVRDIWPDGARGFTTVMNRHQAEAMSHNPRVKYIFENARVHSAGSASVGGSDPRWNLDRIDQRSGTNDTYQYCGLGSGTTIYIIDGGVDARVPEFGSRLEKGANVAPAEDPNVYPDWANFDATNPCGNRDIVGVGHGTAVATVAAGSTLGVARGARVMSVRFRSCTTGGSDTSLTNALKWLRRAPNSPLPANPYYDAAAGRPTGPAIINISQASLHNLTDPETTIEEELRTLMNSGFIVVVSANNQGGQDTARNYIPSRLSYSNPLIPFSAPQRVISVGGTKLVNGNDVRWVCENTSAAQCSTEIGSNYGIGVDLWAPAYDIQSGHIYSLLPVQGEDPWWDDTANQQTAMMRRPMIYNTAEVGGARVYARSGTSFASPLVAGVLARIASEDSSIFNVNSVSLTQERAWSRLKESATLLDVAAANLGSTSTNRFIYAGGNVITLQPTSRVIESGTATTLSVSASGTTPSYTLYAGTSGNTTSQVGAPQASGSFTFTANATSAYWIRASSTCTIDSTTVTSDSAAATVWAFTKPVLTRTSVSATQVTLGWTNAGTGAAYDVYRRITGQSFGPTPLTTVTGLSYSDATVTAGTSYDYKVAARHSPDSGQVESNVLTVIATNLTSPAGLTAASSSGSVSLSWGAVSGADSYKVERRVPGGDWTVALTTANTTASDTPGTGSVVLYRVRAFAGTSPSNPSNNDVAYAGTFTNDPIPTSPRTAAKAEHVTEIRAAINALRVIAGAAAVYTSSELDPNVLRHQVIDDSHLVSLMANLNAARALGDIGLPAVGFQLSPAPIHWLYVSQIEDLRNGLK